MRDLAPTLPAALRELARTCPEEPWLFHRPKWTWQWVSYLQVADQVARTAEALAPVDGRAVCAPLTTPDAVAAALAIQSTGAAAVPSNEESGLEIPPVHRQIDDWTAQEIDDRSEPSGAAFATPDGRVVTHAELRHTAEHWRPRLAGAGRPIVATSPRLRPETRHAAMALLLAQGAAWALEHDPDAFLAAVLWCRPTVAVVVPGEVGELAAALGERRHRRWSRLRYLLVDGETEASGEGIWRQLDVDVLSFMPHGGISR